MSKKSVNKKNAHKNQQVFSLKAPAATRVQLAGNFTRWREQPISLEKTDDGWWRTTLELQPGEYHYRFLVDDEWRDDESCAFFAPNPFGGHNSVRQVL